MNIGIYSRDGFAVAQALADGFRRLSAKPFLRSLSDWRPREPEQFDHVFIFGLRGNGSAILAEHPSAYLVDYGYMRRVMGVDTFLTGHWQVSRGGLNAPTTGPVDAARFNALRLSLRPMRQRGFPRILCAQSVGDQAHPFDTAEKLRQWASSVPHDEYRPHPLDAPQDRPQEPLEAALARAGEVVTWNSTVGIDALLAGVPVEAHGPACYKDVTAENRLEFLRRLAYSQWTMQEMSMGLPQLRILNGDY